MANYLSQSWLIPRRHFLRGLGVSLGLPMLDCMRSLSAVEKVKSPSRSIFIYLPNGVNTYEYELIQSGKNYEFSRILAPLAKHRNNITPISGLYHPNAFGIAHSATQTWLTGAKHGPTDKNTVSVDQMIASLAASKTRFPSLELSNQGQPLSVSPDGIALPTERNPAVVFQDLFVEPKGGVHKQRRRLQRKQSMLDLVMEDAKSLSNKIGNEDRGRLAQYLTAVREVEIRTERAEVWLETPRPQIESSVAAKLNRNIQLERLGEYLRTMYDIIVLAFQTDMTRVVTFNTGNEGTGPSVPEIGISRDRHSLSHHNGDKEILQQLTRSDEFNIQQFAYFLDKLSELKDGEGSLLDTTVCLYGSGLSYGNSHGTTSLPLVLAGGASLGLKHGTHVDYNKQVKNFKGYGDGISMYHSPINSKAHFSNLLLTIAHKMGVQKETFSDSNGVVSEVLS
ncbi:MAG: DUF1552 domain-containing protein [Verrucomicrobiota bacterium]|jgi:hypothetical protein|nr:DUF1552 domain-containing protein [Verrucomicrobiota bacterium]